MPARCRASRASQRFGRRSSGCGGVDEQQVLDDELDVGEPAGAALQVVSRARRFLELAPHREHLGGELRASTGSDRIDRIASVTFRPKPPVAKMTRARVRASRSQVSRWRASK